MARLPKNVTFDPTSGDTLFLEPEVQITIKEHIVDIKAKTEVFRKLIESVPTDKGLRLDGILMCA